MTYETNSLFGSLALFGIALLAYRIYVVGHVRCRYGREALLVWAALSVYIATLRIAADNLHLIDNASTTREWATYGYVVAVVILFRVHRAEQRWHRATATGKEH